MTVKYTITRLDIARWQLYQLMRSKIMMFSVLAIGTMLSWTSMGVPEIANRSITYKISLCLVLTFFAFCILVCANLVQVTLTVWFKKFRGFLCEHELEIREEGLVERTSVNESIHRWAGFDKIVRSGNYIYIYVTDVGVHILPRRIFQSSQQENAFVDEMQRRIDRATGVKS